MTVISSWGGGTSNTYIGFTAADSYLTTSVIDPSAWSDATTAKRDAALIQAALDIDAKQYIGVRFYRDQSLELPRRLDSNFPWGFTDSGSVLGSVIQTRMKRKVEQATALQALHRLRFDGRNKHVENLAVGITQYSESIGPIRESVQYKQSSNVANAVLDARVVQLLSEFITGRTCWRG